MYKLELADVSYLDNDTYKMHIATAWIPFVDATPENGCLEVCSTHVRMFTSNKPQLPRTCS